MQGRSEKTKVLVMCGLLTAAAFVLGYVESLLPFNFGIPGVKIGLANIVTLYALYCLGTGHAAAVLIARIFLSAVTFGNMSALLYSLAGGFLAFGVMWLLKKSKKFGVVGVGIAGGVAHNAGQILMASMMLGSALHGYLPVLLISGSVAGTVIGIAAAELIKRMKSVRIFRK